MTVVLSVQTAQGAEATARFTTLRGIELLRHPGLNKGTAFSAEERYQLGLEGLLPAQVETLELQVERCWQAFQALGSPLEQFGFVEGLRRSNLVLFYRFLSTHLEAVLPVVYTPTVGAVIQRFSRNYRTPQEGLFLSASQKGRLAEVMRGSLTGPVRLVLVTDGGLLIRVPVEDIRIARRSTRGVRLFSLGEGERVVSVSRIIDDGSDGTETGISTE